MGCSLPSGCVPRLRTQVLRDLSPSTTLWYHTLALSYPVSTNPLVPHAGTPGPERPGSISPDGVRIRRQSAFSLMYALFSLLGPTLVESSFLRFCGSAVLRFCAVALNDPAAALPATLPSGCHWIGDVACSPSFAHAGVGWDQRQRAGSQCRARGRTVHRPMHHPSTTLVPP